MSARQDYAKKNTSRSKPKKSRKGAKTRGNTLLRLFFLTLICASIAYVYYARQNLFRLQPEVINVVNATEKPKFEFYSKAPKQKKVEPKAEPELKVAKSSEQKGPYQIQVASMSKADEADQLKAELILDGYNVATKSIKSKAGETVRVTVGPYPTMAEAKQAADILKANSYEGEISAVG